MPDALKLPFAGQDVIDRISDGADEPAWVKADRLASLELYDELPIEPNPLFTLYVDLRGARWSEIEPYTQTGDAQQVSDVVPEGAAALIEIAEDRVVARGLSSEARAGGVVVDTFANMLRDKPEVLRELLDGSPNLPANDKFAQFARSHAALGLFIHVPRNVALEQPIVVRWSMGAP